MFAVMLFLCPNVDKVACAVRPPLDVAGYGHAVNSPETVQAEHGDEARKEALDRRETCVLSPSKKYSNRLGLRLSVNNSRPLLQ